MCSNDDIENILLLIFSISFFLLSIIFLVISNINYLTISFYISLLFFIGFIITVSLWLSKIEICDYCCDNKDNLNNSKKRKKCF